MSTIYFESKNRTVNVRGSERHNAANIINKITDVFLDLDWNRELLLTAVKDNQYLHDTKSSPGWPRDFSSAFHHGGLVLDVDGQKVGGFLLGLNTATAVGDDSMKLLARIHGQCEVHGYVAGKNREWMAQIIENAPVELFRPDSGWEDLVELLRESDDGPVVMSYSVTGGFLDEAMSEWVDDNLKEKERTGWVYDDSNDDGYEFDEGDKWEIAEQEWSELGRDASWDYAVALMYKHSDRGLEITPEKWPIALGFDDMTAGKLIEKLKSLPANSGL